MKKNPLAIVEMGSMTAAFGRGTLLVKTRDGRKWILHAKDLGGIMPRLGDTLDTSIATPFVRQPLKNPSKRKMRGRKRVSAAPMAKALAAFNAAQSAHYKRNPTKRGKSPHARNAGPILLQERRGSGWHTICTMSAMTPEACRKVARKYAARHPGKMLRLFK